MTDFYSLSDRASTEAAELMTKSLFQYLIGAGWELIAAQSVKIVCENDKFSFVFEGAGADAAQTLEYGNEQKRPMASIRKYMNRPAAMEALLMDRLEAHLGELV